MEPEPFERRDAASDTRGDGGHEPRSVRPWELEQAVRETPGSREHAAGPDASGSGDEGLERISAQELRDYVHGNDPEAERWDVRESGPTPIRVAAPRAARFWSLRWIGSEGARFVVSLLVSASLIAWTGYAYSTSRDTHAIIAASLSVPSLVVTWVVFDRWLGGRPYFYRLMTSLGENAENLLGAYFGTLIRSAIRGEGKGRTGAGGLRHDSTKKRRTERR